MIKINWDAINIIDKDKEIEVICAIIDLLRKLGFKAEQGACSAAAVGSLATVPKLYKNPSCFSMNGERICKIFYDDRPGHLAFEIHGERADIIASAIIAMQG